MSGKFIISLDYELMWGVRDKRNINTYGNNIANVPHVIYTLLELFSRYEINATFAIVGFLFAKNKEEIHAYLPKTLPNYSIQKLSPYTSYISSVGNDTSDVYNYGYDSLVKLKKARNHEICSHTFSHYYCLEDGQSEESFKSDLESAISIAAKEDVIFKSIIFPRNQHNVEYNNVLLKNGIQVYRGNEKAWYYNPKKGKDDASIRRIFRLIDTYINISGHNCFSLNVPEKGRLINIPSSRFLRPYNPKFKILECLRLRRIKTSMTYAAKNNLMYHLWWHPHNFGAYQNENFDFLEKILKHYQKLKMKYNFTSCTMKKAANLE